MADLSSILAESGDTDWMKLIPVGIILILWAIGAAASAAKKSAAAKPLPRPVLPPVPPVPRRMPSAPAWAAPPNPPPPPLPRQYAAFQAIAAPPVPRPPPVPRRRKRSALAPPPVAPPLPAAALVGAVADAPQFPGTPQSSEFQLAGGEAGPRLRLTAEALRSAVVFTELFDPPAALRDEGLPQDSKRI